MEPLDNWVWRALTGPHAAFAEGQPPALRYQTDVSVFAALPDVVTPEAWTALGDLVGPDGIAVVFRAEIGPVPDHWSTLGVGIGVQMVGPAPGAARPARPGALPAGCELVTLTLDDVPEMTALVELTEPGPFAARTIVLGTYLGVRREGTLVAMAGERMRLDGYTEVSAVCTHPDHRGLGLAGVLVGGVVDEIHSRGDVPFLHALTTNTVAISRYSSLGFTERARARAAFVSPSASAIAQLDWAPPTESSG